MSGTDYTKKVGIGKKVARIAFARVARFGYELVFLYKSRAEKWLILLTFMLILTAIGCQMYIISTFQAPAPIFFSCPDPG